MDASHEPKPISLIAILSTSFVGMAFSVTLPAMAKIAAQFPTQNYALVGTIFTLSLIPVTLISGWLVAKGSVKCKTLAIAGSLIATLGGVAPAIFNSSFGLVLFWRVMLGVGLGLLAPLGNSLILNLYEGQKQAKYLGWVTLAMNLGGVAFTLLGGVLADAGGANGWAVSFWGYALCAVAFIFSFFIPEPTMQASEKAEGQGGASKVKMGAAIWIICIVYMMIQTLNYPTILNISILFKMRGIGGDAYSTVSALVLTMGTVAGVIAGGAFGSMFKVLKRFILPVGLGVGAFGVFLMYLANGIVLMTVGCFLLNLGLFTVMTTTFMLVGIWTPKSKAAMGTSMLLSFMNAGAFVSSYYLAAVGAATGGDTVVLPLLCEAIFLVVLMVVFLFFNPFPKQPSAVPADASAESQAK